MSEAKFSKYIQNNYDLWNTRIEPSKGMDAGIPDLLLMTQDFGIIPTEIKIGTLSDDKLWCSEIRPSQIQWHKSFAVKNKGINTASVFLVGVPHSGTKWRTFAFKGVISDQWENGFDFNQITELNPIDLSYSFEEFVSGCL